MCLEDTVRTTGYSIESNIDKLIKYLSSHLNFFLIKQVYNYSARTFLLGNTFVGRRKGGLFMDLGQQSCSELSLKP